MQPTSQRNLWIATRLSGGCASRVVALPRLVDALTGDLDPDGPEGKRSFSVVFAAALRLPAVIGTRLMPLSSVALTFSITRPPWRTLPTTRSFSEGLPRVGRRERLLPRGGGGGGKGGPVVVVVVPPPVVETGALAGAPVAPSS